MRINILIVVFALVAINITAQNTIPTTTVSGCLKVTDTLNVTNGIKSLSSITAYGDMVASGEMVAKDTMRAEKDVVVDGNVKVAGDILVNGEANINKLVTREILLNQAPPLQINPCLKIMLAQPTADGKDKLFAADATLVGQIEASLDLNPCPEPPVVPFVWQTYGNHVNSNNRWIGTIENFDFNIRTNSVQRITVKNNGQVLFGAQAIKPNHAHANSNFQFDGKIGCKELVVVDPTKWADFVFDKSYQLMPLKDVENYYLLHKHLPSVPSEKEVKENGINTAEMDAILLQKIEELTLYIVEQQKQIEALKQQIKK